MNTRANMVMMRDMVKSCCALPVNDPNPEIRLECPCASAPLYINDAMR
jgi:hypothetical protein